MLANQKVWGSIPSQGMPFLFCPVLIYVSFTQKLQRKTLVKNTGGTQEYNSLDSINPRLD